MVNRIRMRFAVGIMAAAVLCSCGPWSAAFSAMCYVDNAQSYSTNEITIYWNSPFIYLLSAFR